MTTLVQLKQGVAALMKVMLPNRIIHEGMVGEGAAPNRPYMIYRLESFDLPDSIVNNIDEVGEDFTQSIRAMTGVIFGLSFIGGDAFADAQRFMLSVRMTQRSGDLWKICGLSGFSPIQDLTALEVGAMRQRVDVKMTLFTSLELIETMENIESINFVVNEDALEYSRLLNVTQGENPNGC